MGRQLSTSFRVYCYGFIAMSVLAALVFAWALGYMLMSGESLSVLSNPTLAVDADSYLVSDVIALSVIIVALLAGARATLSDLRQGLSVHPFKGRVTPKGWTMDWIWNLRPEVKLWLVANVILIALVASGF